MLRIVDQNVFGLGDPVGFRQPLAELLEVSLRHAKSIAQRLLLGGDTLAAALLLVAQSQHLLGRLVQIAQELPLPAVPHTRADRANVHDCQAEQQPQPFRTLHHIDEIEDRLIVREVALEGGGRHQQMVPHQP